MIWINVGRQSLLLFICWSADDFQPGFEEADAAGFWPFSAAVQVKRAKYRRHRNPPPPAVEGALHSGTNPARQVNVGCRNYDRFAFLFDADNAIEWVLALSAPS